MAQEVTHILGLRHCIYFSCIMNGNNGDEHAPLQLCPICLRKVHDACKDGNGGRGMDVVERYRSLMMFYDRHGWEESLAFATARHAALSAVGEQTETRHAESTVKRAQAQQHYPKRRRQGARVRLKHSEGHLESSPKPSPKRSASTRAIPWKQKAVSFYDQAQTSRAASRRDTKWRGSFRGDE